MSATVFTRDFTQDFTHYEITPLAFALHFCECVFVPWCVHVEVPGPCFMSPAKHTRQPGLWASEDSSVSLCLPISLCEHWGYRCGLHCVGLHGIWGSQLSASHLCHAVFACWAHSHWTHFGGPESSAWRDGHHLSSLAHETIKKWSGVRTVTSRSKKSFGEVDFKDHSEILV